MAVDMEQLKDLRESTGLPIVECKKALDESGGDMEQAKVLLRKRGVKVAEKRAHREVREGVIGAYVHHDGKKGAMVEVNCETDFVARNQLFQDFVRDLCMHVAWADPACVRREELDGSPNLLEEVRAGLAGTPAAEDEEEVRKIACAKHVLLDQPYLRDDSKTVGDELNELIGKLRENITIGRFSRLELGKAGHQDTKTDNHR